MQLQYVVVAAVSGAVAARYDDSDYESDENDGDGGHDGHDDEDEDEYDDDEDGAFDLCDDGQDGG